MSVYVNEFETDVFITDGIILLGKICKVKIATKKCLLFSNIFHRKKM